MVKRINKLTPAQEAQRKPWAEQWIRVGLCCDEADWATSEAGIAQCYGFAKSAWHENYVRASNPFAMAIAAPCAAWILEQGLRDGVPVRESLGPWAEYAVSDLPEHHRFIAPLIAECAAQAIEGAGISSIPMLLDMERPGLQQAIHESLKNCVGGCWWIHWQAYESFFRLVCNLEHGKIPQALAFEAAQKSSGWWWPHKQFVMVSDRPREIHIEQIRPEGYGSRQLSNETGPALSYRDGFALYYWHGFEVPPHVVMEPERITLEEIARESSVEVRRIMIERYGAAKYLQDTGAQIMSMDFESPRKGAAPRMLVQDAGGDRFLIGTDGGTSRLYAMPVARECASPKEAHEGICGFDESRVVSKS